MKFSVNQFLICAVANESNTLCQSAKQSETVDIYEQLKYKKVRGEKAQYIIQEYFFFLDFQLMDGSRHGIMHRTGCQFKSVADIFNSHGVYFFARSSAFSK